MKKVLWGLVLIIVVIFLPTHAENGLGMLHNDIDDHSNSRIHGHLNTIKDWLQGDLDEWGKLPHFLKTVALMASSYSAMGLLNIHFMQKTSESDLISEDELKQMITRMVELVLKKEITHTGYSVRKKLPRAGYGIQMGHINLVLGAYRIITDNKNYDKLHKRLSQYIHKHSLNRKEYYIIPPYRPTLKVGRFIADQSAALLSLYLYDQIHRTELSVAPYKKLIQRAENDKVFQNTQLHPSGWKWSYRNQPRGVGIAYSLQNLGQIDPVRMKKLYHNFRKRMYVDWNEFGGFREWPENVHQVWDADGGPIFFGIGTSASALGLGPARLFQDRQAYSSLIRLGGIIGGSNNVFPNRTHIFLQGAFASVSFMSGFEFVTKPLEQFLHQSIDPDQIQSSVQAFSFFTDAALFCGVTTIPWFHDISEYQSEYESSTPWISIFCSIILFLLGALALLRLFPHSKESEILW